MTDTITKTQVSEEEQDNQRFEELKKKDELNEEEQQEMAGLKERHASRTQKRIDQLSWRAKDAEERYGKASQEVEDLKRRIDELENQKNKEPARIVKDTVEIAGKQYYTDEALMSMVNSGELTNQDAYKLQRQRDKAELRNEVLTDIKNEQKRESEQQIRAKDREKVLASYPHFSDKHPDFNPNDPLYKEVTRLWNNGYAANPKGLSLAIEDAKKILRLTDSKPDVSDDLGVRSPNAPDRGKKTESVPLTDEEKEGAIRMYTMGENPPTNPKTGKPYTVDEALRKAQDAKNKRMQSRRIT